MENIIENILSHFDINTTDSKIIPIKNGHINDTYHFKPVDNNLPGYVLQKINHYIFKDIEALTKNILEVTRHIAKKIEEQSTDKLLTAKLVLINTKNNEYYLKDIEGNYWRLYNYIAESICYDIIDEPHKAYNAAMAFGKYQSLLADLNPSLLNETIPDFHNMKTRYKTFLETLDKNPVNRVQMLKKEIAFVKSRIDEMLGMQKLIDDNLIPIRITHNDTKINNILFDKNENPICIIDLDLVMPGSVLYDFGDGIRTAASITREDDTNLDDAGINIKLFSAFTEGYFKSAFSFLTTTEIENLPLSAKYITFIMGLRFLTDYIDGDKYYKISHKNHNIDRARNQFKLLENMELHFTEMKDIVKSIKKANLF